MSATHHPCDICRRIRHLRDLRSIGDGRVVCLDDHPDVLPIGEGGRMPAGTADEGNQPTV